MKCKKIFALLLSLCMIASLFVAMPVSASNTMTVTVGNVEAAAGDTIEVPVTLANNTVGLCGLTLDFTYDKNVLSYKKAVAGDALTDTMALTKPGSSFTEGNLRFLWDAMEADYTNGTILVITFEVAASATSGDYAVDVAVKAACDFDFNDIDTDAVGGTVTIPGETTGDDTPSVSDKMTVTVGNVEAKAGDTIEVPVTLANNTVGLCGLTLDFTYDPDVLKYVSAVQGDALKPGMALTKPGSASAEGTKRFLWDAMDPDYENGEILVITFKVEDGAAAGEYPVDVEVKTACDFDYNDLETVAVGGTVTVKEPELMAITVGDVEAKAGDTIEVPVTLANNTVGLCGLTLDFTYDKNVLSYKKAIAGDALTDTMALTKPGSSFTEGNLRFLWDSMDADYSNGTILVITFEVAAGAAGGDYAVDVAVKAACDFDFNDIETDAIGGTVTVEGAAHVCTWDTGVVTKPATCVDTGIMTYTCTVCGETKTEEIPVDATAHAWDDGTVTVEATHTTDGVKTFTCVCGDTYTESIPANVDAHEYDDGVVTKAATCTEDGVKTFTCTCGDAYTETIPATGHAYDAGVVTKAATCTEVGVKTFTCGNCGDTYTEEIPALGHDTSFVAEIPATCTVDGTESHYLCANCGKTFKDEAANTEVTAEELVIAALGHSYGNWTKDDDDNHKKVCTACGDIVKEAHTWGAGVITLQPTRTEDGEWEFTCSVCEGTKTETINKVSESDNITNVTVENVTTKSGQEIAVPVKISKNAGLVGLILNVEYDKNVLTLIGAEEGTGLGSLDLTIPDDLSQQPAIFLWDGLNADNSNGEIVILKFKVADGAAEGEYPVSVTVTSACDNDLNDVIVCANDGAVNVLNYAPGDLDADGKIGAKDIVLIRRFITAGYNVSIIEDAADVNNDGVVEVKDVVLIRRYIVGGFDVTLK